ALAVEMAFVDAQMVEQREMIVGIAVPIVLGGDRRARLAAGVALIHRDDAVFAGELDGRVDRRRGLAPNIDDRAQPGRREGEDRKAAAKFLVMNMGAMVVEAGHAGGPFAATRKWRRVTRQSVGGRVSIRIG